jgi:hypothetical protein
MMNGLTLGKDLHLRGNSSAKWAMMSLLRFGSNDEWQER